METTQPNLQDPHPELAGAAGDSMEQREAETVMIQALSEQMGVPLAPNVKLRTKDAYVVLDGCNEGARIFCSATWQAGSTDGASGGMLDK